MPQSFSITDIGLRREMNQDYVFSSDLPLGPLSCLYAWEGTEPEISPRN